MNNVTLSTKVIVSEKIFSENRKGTEILIIQDGNQQQYSTAKDYIRNTVLKRKERFIGRRWRIAYTEKKNGLKDFYSFLFPVPKKVSEKQQLRSRVQELEQKLEAAK